MDEPMRVMVPDYYPLTQTERWLANIERLLEQLVASLTQIPSQED